jgi:hypothetical protein
MILEVKIWGKWRKVLREHPELFEESMLAFEEFHWVWKILMTRAFGKYVPWTTLAPLAEFLNHGNVHTFYYYYHPNDYIFRSTKEDQEQDDNLFEKVNSIKFTNQQIVALKFRSMESNDKTEEAFAAISKEASTFDESKRRRDENEEDEILDSDDKVFAIIAGNNEKYLKGAELYLSYGRYSNRHLLSFYGFAMANNKYNYARVKVPFKSLGDESLVTEIVDAGMDRMTAFKMKPNQLNLELLHTIRSLKWNISTHKLDCFFAPADFNFELEVLNKAVNVLIDYLASFPTTYEQDEELILKTDSIRMKFAVFYSLALLQNWSEAFYSVSNQASWHLQSNSIPTIQLSQLRRRNRSGGRARNG